MFGTAALAGFAVAIALSGPGPGRLDLIVVRPGAAVRRAVGGRSWSFGVRLGPALTGLAVLVWVGPAGAVVAAVLTETGRRALRRRREAAVRESERTGAVEACAVLAAELTAGRGPADALAAAATVATGPVATALATAAAGVPFGGQVPEVLTAAAGSSAVPDLLRGLAACWSVCSTTGAGLAAAVDRLTEVLRAEHRQRREVEAELAAPKATAALLALLPLVGTLLAAGLGAKPLQVLLHTPVGISCLLLGVALDLIGLWWTGRLVAAAGGAP